jgi:hypothetical protein
MFVFWTISIIQNRKITRADASHSSVRESFINHTHSKSAVDSSSVDIFQKNFYFFFHKENCHKHLSFLTWVAFLNISSPPSIDFESGGVIFTICIKNKHLLLCVSMFECFNYEMRRTTNKHAKTFNFRRHIATTLLITFLSEN